MKKKLLAVMLVVVMVLASAVTAFAADDASITIKNAAKGETYTAYRIFDVASYSADGGVVYKPLQGKGIPNVFQDILEVDSVTGEIVYKVTPGEGDNEGKFMFGTEAYATEAEAKAAAASAFDTAMQNWAKPTGTAEAPAESAAVTWAKANGVKAAEEVATGGALKFDNLPHGYYVVASTQGHSASIVSTDGAEADNIYDKNSKTIKVVKDVNFHDWSIGDTVTYTATFDTVNYLGEGADSKQVIQYTIKDTLPNFLTDVEVKSITVGGVEITTKTNDVVDEEFQFGTDKQIVLPWAEEVAGSNPKEYNNLYANGAKMIVTYTAKLTAVTNVNAKDINIVSLHPKTWDGTTEGEPWDENWKDEEWIITYAAALHKVDGGQVALPGAEFTIKGLVVNKVEDGVYEVVSYDPASNAQSDTLTTDSTGKLYIIGLDSDVTLTVTETKAPDGYNKLNAPFEVKSQVLENKQIYHKEGYAKYDEKGNLVEFSETEKTDFEATTPNLNELDAQSFEVVNNKGTELPGTGGIGTTILYTIGGILVVGAGVLLVARRKMER